MNFRPLHDHVIIKPLNGEEKTVSGIVVQQGIETHYAKGKVLSCGPGHYNAAGNLVPVSGFTIGDTVLYPVRGVTPMRIEGEDIVLAKAGALVGVF